jgi:hypothetical protein
MKLILCGVILATLGHMLVLNLDSPLPLSAPMIIPSEEVLCIAIIGSTNSPSEAQLF